MDVRLHAATLADFAPLLALMSLPAVCRFLSDGAPPTPELVTPWFDEAPADARDLGGGLWLAKTAGPGGGVSDPADAPALVGAVRLSRATDDELELTYLLHPDHWGRGLATAMAHGALGRAFASPRCASVMAGADAPNRASIAVMERLGLTFRRSVRYPLGEGVEYAIERSVYDPGRLPSIPFEEESPA